MTKDFFPSKISLVASINLLFFAAGGILAGRLLDRIAPRWVATTGAAVAASGFFFASFNRAPETFYLSCGLLCGLGSAWTGIVVGVGGGLGPIVGGVLYDILGSYRFVWTLDLVLLAAAMAGMLALRVGQDLNGSSMPGNGNGRA